MTSVQNTQALLDASEQSLVIAKLHVELRELEIAIQKQYGKYELVGANLYQKAYELSQLIEELERVKWLKRLESYRTHVM